MYSETSPKAIWGFTGASGPRSGQLDIGQSYCREKIVPRFTIEELWKDGSPSPGFIPRLTCGKGRRLPRVSRLRNRVLSLFYSHREEFRRIPVRQWFSDKFRIPKYYFRVSGRSMSDRQKIVSTIFRMYNSYIQCAKGLTPSQAYKYAVGCSVNRLILRISCKNWYAPCEMAYRRLKVLLSPFGC